MSRSFLGIRQLAYKGVYSALDSQLCKPASQPSRLVPLTIDWSVYGASSTVTNVMVQAIIPQPVADRLGKIGSLYIDNTGSISPVYVNFPDTGFTITAAPATAVWYPVVTNGFVFNVILEQASSSAIPTTQILISNQQIGPSADPEVNQAIALYKASPLALNNYANYTQGSFGPAALIDLNVTAVLGDLSLLNTFPITEFSNNTAPSVITIGAICASIIRCLGGQSITCYLRKNTVPVLQWDFKCDTTGLPAVIIEQTSGIQFRLDGTATYDVINNVQGTGGAFILKMYYSKTLF